MDRLRDKDVTIHLDLMVRFGFYQIFNPNSKKIFNCNVYQFFLIVITVVEYCALTFGMLGCFVKTGDFTQNLLLLCIILYNHIIIGRLIIYLYNTCTFWSVLNIAKINFLTSKQCRKNDKILYEYGKRSRKLLNVFFIVVVSTFVQWIIFPLVFKSFNEETENLNNKRTMNIIDMRYPVSTYTYNQYYIWFYLIDLIITTYVMLGSIIFDSFLFMFCFVIIAQNRVLAQSFKNIGYENKSQTGNYITKLKLNNSL